MNSPASTAAVVILSTLGGMFVDLVNAAWTGITGPQATLVIGGAGLLFQVVKWLVDSRRPRKER